MVKLLVKHKANARAKTYDELTPAFLTKDPDILAVSFLYDSQPTHPPWSFVKLQPVFNGYLASYPILVQHDSPVLDVSFP